jgi:ectoine hydroxylase-related dioxygenase (phytanoyl-CoA dioxygenase family)
MVVTNLPIELSSNGYKLSTAPNRLGHLQPSDPTTPIQTLREQYQAQGYLWLKNILDRGAILRFRRRYFEAFRDTPLLAAGSDPAEGLYSGEPVPNFNKLLVEIVRWAAYESFCLSEPIWQFYERFLGGAPYLHKRKLIRHTLPGDPSATGAHYDLVYLRGGTTRLCTSWIPIGDTSVMMGGLAYLEGSDAWSRRQEAIFTEQNRDLKPEEKISAYNRSNKTGWLSKDLATLVDELDMRWLVADYEAGDMVVHSPYMVHASTMNIDPDNRIRLSTDIRYQLVREEIDIRWNNHWSFDDML